MDGRRQVFKSEYHIINHILFVSSVLICYRTVLYINLDLVEMFYRLYRG